MRAGDRDTERAAVLRHDLSRALRDRNHCPSSRRDRLSEIGREPQPPRGDPFGEDLL